MMIIGIDPGKTGGIAILSEGSAAVLVMPPLRVFIDLLLFKYHSGKRPHLFIEKAQSFPGQGISSAFNYGTHFGELLGVVQALSLSHTLVPPRTWTKVMHAGTRDGEPKTRSLEAVKRLFPKVTLFATPRCKKPHDGIIDALLIAEYGRRQLGVST